MEKADRNRLHSLAAEVVEDRGKLREIERLALLARYDMRPGTSRRRWRGTNGAGFS